MDFSKIPKENFLTAMAVMEQTIISMVTTMKGIETPEAEKAAAKAMGALKDCQKAIGELQ